MCYCPTPTLHLNLALTGDGAFLFSLKKTHSVWFISVLNYGDTENVLINHLLLVIPMSYPCHYTNLCPHKPHKHAPPHTHTHTHTHTHWKQTQRRLKRVWELSVEDRAVNYLNSGVSLIIVRKCEGEGNEGRNREQWQFSTNKMLQRQSTHTHTCLSCNRFLNMQKTLKSKLSKFPDILIR